MREGHPTTSSLHLRSATSTVERERLGVVYRVRNIWSASRHPARYSFYRERTASTMTHGGRFVKFHADYVLPYFVGIGGIDRCAACARATRHGARRHRARSTSCADWYAPVQPRRRRSVWRWRLRRGCKARITERHIRGVLGGRREVMRNLEVGGRMVSGLKLATGLYMRGTITCQRTTLYPRSPDTDNVPSCL